jgi:hypothetical protein
MFAVLSKPLSIELKYIVPGRMDGSQIGTDLFSVVLI